MPKKTKTTMLEKLIGHSLYCDTICVVVYIIRNWKPIDIHIEVHSGAGGAGGCVDIE